MFSNENWILCDNDGYFLELIESATQIVDYGSVQRMTAQAAVQGMTPFVDCSGTTRSKGGG